MIATLGAIAFFLLAVVIGFVLMFWFVGMWPILDWLGLAGEVPGLTRQQRDALVCLVFLNWMTLEVLLIVFVIPTALLPSFLR